MKADAAVNEKNIDTIKIVWYYKTDVSEIKVVTGVATIGMEEYELIWWK